MGWSEIEEYLVTDKGSEQLKKQYEKYCDWCWGHGYGNCDYCKKQFGKVYRPIRIKEIQRKLGLDGEHNE